MLFSWSLVTILAPTTAAAIIPLSVVFITGNSITLNFMKVLFWFLTSSSLIFTLLIFSRLLFFSFFFSNFSFSNSIFISINWDCISLNCSASLSISDKSFLFLSISSFLLTSLVWLSIIASCFFICFWSLSFIIVSWFFCCLIKPSIPLIKSLISSFEKSCDVRSFSIFSSTIFFKEFKSFISSTGLGFSKLNANTVGFSISCLAAKFKVKVDFFDLSKDSVLILAKSDLAKFKKLFCWCGSKLFFKAKKNFHNELLPELLGP